jgi:hypothetical protein
MTTQYFPTANTKLIDQNQWASIPWRKWFEALNAALEAGVISDAKLTEYVTKILVSLGTTDGTADTIISVIDTQIQGLYPVIVTGDMRDGFLVKLPDGFGAQPTISPWIPFDADTGESWPNNYPGSNGRDGRDGVSMLMLSSDYDPGEAWPAGAPASAGITEAMVMAHVAGSV